MQGLLSWHSHLVSVMDWILPFGAFILASIIGVGYSFYSLNKTKKDLESDLLTWKKGIEDYSGLFQENLEAQLKPILDTNSRVMGIISEKGRVVKGERKAMELLGEDLIEQNELLLSAVDTVSPKLSEYLRGNPEQLITMMPRIQAIAEKMGIEIPGLPSPSSRTHHPHPFRDEV